MLQVSTWAAECSAIRSKPNNSLWQKQAKEDVETRRDLTGRRPAIHSFSARLRLNTSLRITCKNTVRTEFHFTLTKYQSNSRLFEANGWIYFMWAAESFYCTYQMILQGHRLTACLGHPPTLTPCYRSQSVSETWTKDINIFGVSAGNCNTYRRWRTIIRVISLLSTLIGESPHLLR